MNAPQPLEMCRAQTAPRWLSPTWLDLLGPGLATAVPPQPLQGLYWVARNQPLAQALQLGDWLAGDSALRLLGGSVLPPEGAGRASVYSGHQFGLWAGALGDGRALALGEIDSPGGALAVQLKGSGPTPYSRGGDGRASLRCAMREYLGSEAMQALGIPTTRALALVGSTTPLQREAAETAETATVLTRLAPSLVRFGHVEHLAQRAEQRAQLQQLCAALIERFYPECQTAPQPASALLEQVARRTARLVAAWQAVGFCHGAMNTDNMSILGLTLGYGRFGFLEAYDPGHVCNPHDEHGRYAYFRQPSIAYWNLHALAQALMPLVDADNDALVCALETFQEEFSQAMAAHLRAKLGLLHSHADDLVLADDWLRLMAADRVDHTNAWRGLCDFDPPALPGPSSHPLRDLFSQREAFDAWARRYVQRRAWEPAEPTARRDRMRRANPKFILRQHLSEAAIRQAQAGDFSALQRLLKVLSKPFDEQPEHQAYAATLPDVAPLHVQGHTPHQAQPLEVPHSS